MNEREIGQAAMLACNKAYTSLVAELGHNAVPIQVFEQGFQAGMIFASEYVKAAVLKGDL